MFYRKSFFYICINQIVLHNSTEMKAIMKKSQMNNQQMIAVDKEEIIFFSENWPIGFQRIVSDKLKSQGHHVDRQKVQRELTMIKKSYNKAIIDTARELLEALTGKKYNSHI